MSYTITAGPSSLVLNINTPFETDGITPRDDLIGLKVWASTTTGFTPSAANLVYNGTGLTVTYTGLAAGVTWYVRYALISEIEPDNYTISNEITATPLSASAQTVDISGFTAFSKAGTTFTPATATLTAVLNGITTPQYAWTITGGTLSASNTAAVTVTPVADATSISVTLSVTGVGLTTPITKTIVMAIVTNGVVGYSPPTFYINNYGSTFRKDISDNIYPTSVIIETGYANFKDSPAPGFQWKKDGVNISGATSFSYSVPASDYAMSTTHTYSCVITGKDLAGADKSITASTTIPLISDGVRGPRTASGYIYYDTPSASAPGIPTASNYNFSTGQFGTLTSAAGNTGTWIYTPVSPSTTNTSLKVWASRYVVLEPAYGQATGAATISTPSNSITFDGIVTFSNYNTGTTPLATAASVNSKLEAGTSLNNALALNTTVIDGGRITTGVIAAANLDLSGVLTATSVSNTGTTQIDGGRIKTGIIEANRIDLTGVLKISSTNANGSVNTTTQINGGSLQTGSINADRLTIGQTTAANRIRMYDNRIEIWAERYAGDTTGARRVVLGDLT
jgi:hypothetical protein